MSTITDLTLNRNRRHEHRRFLRVFIKIKNLNESGYRLMDALTTDISDSGLGLMTYQELPVSTRIAINLADELAATAEVVNIFANERGMVRLGVRFIDKIDNWPL